MYGTHNSAAGQLAATGAVGVGYQLLGAAVLAYAGAALVVIAAVIKRRHKKEVDQ